MPPGRFRFAATAAFALAVGVAAPAAAISPINKSLFGGVAIEGTDPVAYFTDGKPVEGRKEFSFEWMGATWRFASAEHRDLFAADPGKYAPQYGGYCSYAVGRGYTAGIDPEAWTIHDGKLYLNYDESIRAEWLKEMEAYIAKADANWPKLLAK